MSASRLERSSSRVSVINSTWMEDMLVEIADAFGEIGACDSLHRRDPDRAAGIRLLKPIASIIELAWLSMPSAYCNRRRPVSVRVKPDLLRLNSVELRLLQFADPPADRGMVHLQLLGGANEVSLTRHFQKVDDVVPVITEFALRLRHSPDRSSAAAGGSCRRPNRDRSALPCQLRLGRDDGSVCLNQPVCKHVDLRDHQLLPAQRKIDVLGHDRAELHRPGRRDIDVPLRKAVRRNTTLPPGYGYRYGWPAPPPPDCPRRAARPAIPARTARARRPATG